MVKLNCVWSVQKLLCCLCHPIVEIHEVKERVRAIAKISVTSPIVINMPTRELLVGETKSSFV